jgi:hypothetical protein
MLKTSLAFALTLSVPAVADDAGPKIVDTFAFQTMAPKKKCAKVTGALKQKLEKNYTCFGPGKDEPGSASGKPIAARCEPKSKKTRGEYLLFATNADCNEERETQLANGD